MSTKQHNLALEFGLTAGGAARLLYVSRAHSFARDYGISPINCLLSRRLQESCTLLQTTDHSLAEIAQITGLSSPSYFSRSFRKAKGMSPAQYRKNSEILGRVSAPFIRRIYYECTLHSRKRSHYRAGSGSL